MKWSEIKLVSPASVFVLLFTSCFIVSLAYCLAVNLGFVPRFSAGAFEQARAKLDALRPVPRSLAYALCAGVGCGVVGVFVALVYNVFSGIFGGFRAEIEE